MFEKIKIIKISSVIKKIAMLFFTIYMSIPGVLAHTVKTLTLEDAIVIALRDNPNIASTRLAYLLQQYTLSLENWQFTPHYALHSSISFNRTKQLNQAKIASRSFNIEPQVTLLTPIGTDTKLSFANEDITAYQPALSLEVRQPLLRGFGRPIVEAALNNAKDSVIIARLNIENILRETVTAVINAYLDVMSAEKNITIDENALLRAEKSVEQTKLYIKAGHKARNEVITVEANVASAKAQLENDRNHYQQMLYALLAVIGLDPNQEIHLKSLNLDELISKYQLLPLEKIKTLALENDIQFKTDQLTLAGTLKRSLLKAQDGTRWQLDLFANKTLGRGERNGSNSGIVGLLNGKNQTTNIGLTLDIPIDDRLAKQALMNAEIAIKEANIALKQKKWQKETNAINGFNSLSSVKRALYYALAAEKLQKTTYDLSYQKYLHGLIGSLELQTAQVQLIQAEQAELNAKINYLKVLVNMDLLIGNTLNSWHIKTRL